MQNVQNVQNVQSASTATAHAQQASTDEKAYGPTVWGDTVIESDPWKNTKSEYQVERPVAAAVPSVFDKDVDASFTAWMFGVEAWRADRPGAAERRAIEQLMQAGHGDGLAAARLADQADGVAALQREADVADGKGRTALGLQLYAEVVDFQHRLSLAGQSRVHQVAQAVAEQVQAEHRQRNRHAGEYRQQRRLEQQGLGLGQHAAP